MDALQLRQAGFTDDEISSYAASNPEFAVPKTNALPSEQPDLFQSLKQAGFSDDEIGDYQKRLGGSPASALPISRVQIPQMTTMPQEVNAEESLPAVIGKSVMGGLGNIGVGLLGAGKAVADIFTGEPKPAGPIEKPTGEYDWPSINEIADTVAREWTPRVGESVAKKYAAAVAQSTATSLPMMLTGPAALPLFGVTSGGNKYLQLREAGKDILTSWAVAAPVGFSEAITEKLPLREMKKLGTPLIRRLVNSVGLEIPGEVINTIVEDSLDKAVLRPEMTWKDFGQDIVDTVVTTVGQSLLTAGLMHGMIREKGGAQFQTKEEYDNWKKERFPEGFNIEEAVKQVIQPEQTSLPIEEPEAPKPKAPKPKPTEGLPIEDLEREIQGQVKPEAEPVQKQVIPPPTPAPETILTPTAIPEQAEEEYGKAIPEAPKSKPPYSGHPIISGLEYKGVQEIPGQPDQYVFTETKTGDTFYTTDLSKEGLIANRDRIRQKWEEAEKRKRGLPGEQLRYVGEIRELRGLVERGEAGKRTTNEAGETVAFGSSYPAFMSNKGWTRDEVLAAIDKGIAGEKLGPKQQEIWNTAKQEARSIFKDRIAEQKKTRQEAIPTGDLAVGDQVKVQNEILTVTEKNDDRLVIKDGQEYELDPYFDVIRGKRVEGKREALPVTGQKEAEPAKKYPTLYDIVKSGRHEITEDEMLHLGDVVSGMRTPEGMREYLEIKGIKVTSKPELSPVDKDQYKLPGVKIGIEEKKPSGEAPTLEGTPLAEAAKKAEIEKAQPTLPIEKKAEVAMPSIGQEVNGKTDRGAEVNGIVAEIDEENGTVLIGLPNGDIREVKAETITKPGEEEAPKEAPRLTEKTQFNAEQETLAAPKEESTKGPVTQEGLDKLYEKQAQSGEFDLSKIPGDLMIEREAISEKTQKTFKIKQNAKEALAEIDNRMNLFKAFMECVKS